MSVSESDIEESPKPVGKKNNKAAVVDAKTNSTATPTSKDKAQNASAGKTNTTTTPAAKGTDKAQNTPKQQAQAVAAAQPKVLVYLALTRNLVMISSSFYLPHTNIKHVDNNLAGCQESIKTLITLATYYIKLIAM